MNEWRKAIISPDASLRDAIACIDSAGFQLAIALNGDGTLAGLLSDGDVRRAILRGCDLATPTRDVMNAHPTTALASSSKEDLLSLMRRKVLRQLPLVNERGEVVGLATVDELAGVFERTNWVVLMAGGLGTRLRPLTETIPKPLLPVSGKPILETILESFVEQGFRRFFVSVNYMAESVRKYFGDGAAWGVKIHYLFEKKRLGTAGALSLLPERPTEPFLVMNGDLLTRVRFDNMLHFHTEHGASATMAVREYDFQVPYGVVRLDSSSITAIDEKPVHRFFVNAGIYALSPEVLDLVPPDEFFDMPTLFQRVMANGRRSSAYPIHEYWLDVGRIEEFERAQKEWSVLPEGPDD
jgi:dTDP-glucose pyrophosphorylase